jgi:hypothetical protein
MRQTLCQIEKLRGERTSQKMFSSTSLIAKQGKEVAINIDVTKVPTALAYRLDWADRSIDVNTFDTLITSFELVFLLNVKHAETINIRCELRQASQITHPSSELLSAGQYVEKEKELPTKPPGLNT